MTHFLGKGLFGAVWFRCLDHRVAHMVIDNRRGAGIGFLAAECGRSVYPLKVAEPSRRRCARCEATLPQPHPEAA